jgi:glycerol dehydrogenase
MNEVKMNLNTMTLPGYTILSDTSETFEKWIASDANVVVLGGHTALSLTKPYLQQLNTQSLSVFWTDRACNQSNHDRLRSEFAIVNCDLIIGVGGGRALDMAKWVADSLQKPILCIPTIASTCAACSAVSVVYDENHQFLRIHELRNTPQHILFLPDILVKAPPSFLHAGIGDAISKPIEINFSGKHEAWSYPNQLGKTIAENSLKILIEQGESAYEANRVQHVNASFLNVVSAIIMGIGYASILVEEDYNSALAHALYNAFMAINAVKQYPHGLVVAYGVLVQCLVDGDRPSFDRLYPFYQRLKLPTSLEAIGTSIDHPDLPSVVNEALRMPDCRFVSTPLTQKNVLEAMRHLESMTLEEMKLNN